MYRACSTWQYAVVAHLLEHHLGGRRLGYLTGAAYTAQAARCSGPDGQADHRPRWAVLKSHEGDRHFTRMLASGEALAVYAYRDIRDVVCSLGHKQSLTSSELIRRGMIHQILANDRFWRAQPRVLIQRYEELILDPVTAVVQLARHLGLGVTRRQAAQIAEEYSWDSNRARIETLRRRLVTAGIDLNAPSNHQICDPVTLLHWNHLRPGGSVCWRTDFAPGDLALLEGLCGKWLRANGYSASGCQRHTPSGTAADSPLPHQHSRLILATGKASYLLRHLRSSSTLPARRLQRFCSAVGVVLRLVVPPKGHRQPIHGRSGRAAASPGGSRQAVVAPGPVSQAVLPFAVTGEPAL